MNNNIETQDPEVMIIIAFWITTCLKKERILFMKDIIIKGAREHNLKNVDVKIPRNKLVVLTGLSGSGKSSLAFDTLYAEGRRRYVESLSSYARQFIGQLEKSDVDYIEGLSPAISIEQKTTSNNPRSTVGTTTEIYDYIRLLYARIGVPHCPKCGRIISGQTIDQIVKAVMKMPDGTKIQVLSPIVRSKKGMHEKEISNVIKNGFVRARIDGEIYDLSDDIELDKNKKHDIEIVVDRLIISKDIVSRLSDSIETALNFADGLVIINVINGEDLLFSRNYACPEHGISIGELSPKFFSFNSPQGACDKCMGIGTIVEVDVDMIIPNKNLSIRDGAINVDEWSLKNDKARLYFKLLSEIYDFSLDSPIKDLDNDIINVILYGNKDKTLKIPNKNAYKEFKSIINDSILPFEGIVNDIYKKFKETKNNRIKEEIESNYMNSHKCNKCKGKRLSDNALAVTVGGINISDFSDKSVGELISFIDDLNLTEKDEMIARPILVEIKNRLTFLNSVGLDYLTLSRASYTLSGGESQRIRLATQLGASLTGVLYVLDEPSIGLHQCDNDKLIKTLKNLRDLGNTVVVVEHDEDMIRSSDYVIDVGPGAGVHGGEIVCAGTVDKIKKCKKSITGQYLTGDKSIPVPDNRRKGNGKELKIIGARQNNLKNLNISIPLGTFVCVTGVSGSGKSSLVNDVIYKALSQRINKSKQKPGLYKEILGLDNIDKVIGIDQSPIGRTPRSNPATYTGVFTDIRELFASTNGAKIKGFSPRRFSFNVEGGRCEACKGDGLVKIEMHFLPDIYVPCEICQGKRYNRETLDVKYKEKNIHDVLEMTIDEGLNFFNNIPRIERKIRSLNEVGLGYVKIGQPSTTLSGGEAQRVKLAAELSKRSTGKTIYVLDEPTTGLHIADVHKLIDILQRLVDDGNTVLVIEHNLDLIKTADYIIDLGPGGGNDGGMLVASGTPEEIARVEESSTGQYLRKMLNV